MASDGVQLAQSIRDKAAEFRSLCSGIDEATASRAPEGRWSPKQIVSHLIGGTDAGFLPLLRVFVDHDTPELKLDPGNPHFTNERARMPMSELLAEFDDRYEGIANFIAGLTPEQLRRKAHVPDLRETPMGEYPTLAAFTAGIAEGHLSFHIGHMGEILQALQTSGKQ
jgi:hypothetical protein